MSINTTLIEIYESKKESLNEDKVFELIGIIHQSISNGELTTDVQAKLLDKLATKCKNSNQKSYLKKALQESQTKSLVTVLAELIRKRKVSSKELVLDPSTSFPPRKPSEPILIVQSRSIDAPVLPNNIRLKPLQKTRYSSISTPVQSDASDSLSDRDSARSSNQDSSRTESDEFKVISDQLGKAIQNFVEASVKKTLAKQ